MTSKGDFY